MGRNLGPQPRPFAPRLSDAHGEASSAPAPRPPWSGLRTRASRLLVFLRRRPHPTSARVTEGGERQRRRAQGWFPYSPFLLTRPFRTRPPTSRPRFYGSLAWPAGGLRALSGVTAGFSLAEGKKGREFHHPMNAPSHPVCFLEHQPLWGAVGIVDLELADPRFYLFFNIKADL